MKRLGMLTIVVCLAAGCGAQREVLGIGGTTLLTTLDVLAVPGQPVDLTARLQHGDLLQGKPGYVVRFFGKRGLYRATETDDGGVARVAFTPAKAGEYPFTVSVSPIGIADDPPAEQRMTVWCRKPDTPIVVVDLDKTVVASGFDTVLLGRAGQAEPMPHSQEVLRRLAATHTILYLTHRPDYFSIKSRSWLTEHKYPPGPLLLSSLSGFLSGSETFKSRMLAGLRKHFTNMKIGIGDKIGDGMAYHTNGLRAFVIVRIPGGRAAEELRDVAKDVDALPAAVSVVTGWDQVSRILEGRAAHPPSVVAMELRSAADALDRLPKKKEAQP